MKRCAVPSCNRKCGPGRRYCRWCTMEALAAIRREYVRDLKTPTYVMYPESEGREALPIDIDADQLHSDQSGYD